MSTEPMLVADHLIVELGGRVRTERLAAAGCTLGRAPDNQIVLQDPRASRYHARIELGPAGWVIEDLASQNGTWVGGRRVQREPLGVGLEVRIGSAVLRLQSGASAPAVEAPRRNTKSAPALLETVGPKAAPTKAQDLRAPAVERSSGGEALVDRYRRLQTLARGFASASGKGVALQAIVDAAVAIASAERGFLLTRNKDGLHFAAARNIAREEVSAPEFEVSWSIAIAAGTRGESVLTVNAKEDPRYSAFASVETLGLRSILAVPVPGPKGILGAIYLDHRLEGGAFGPDDLELAQAVAVHAGIALAHAAQLEDVLRESRGEAKLLPAAERAAPRDVGRLIGDSARMDELRMVLRKVAATDFPVLIQGESGTGKELVARSIHEQSRRAREAFVSIHCAAIPESLLESELFGVERGAFTGAEAARDGLFVQAKGGTVFLDEVAEMSPAMQTRLLRVLQEGEVRPIGAKAPVKIDARVIAATHRDLSDLVREGSFREDLYYRLQVLPVRVPPLRARREDIPVLIQHFFERHGRGACPRISAEAMDLLASHAWPGNVRELENEVRRLLAIAGDRVGREDLSPAIRDARDLLVGRNSSFADLNDLVQAVETREIHKALTRSEGNKTRAAELLGITRFALQRKLEKYGLDEAGDPLDAPHHENLDR